MAENIAGYVFSTASTSMEFRAFGPKIQGRFPETKYKVTIMGGANCPDKFLRTPKGIATPVTAEQLSFLMTNPNFLRAKKRGFMEVSVGGSDADLAAAVAGMQAADKSRPRVESDFETPPKTGKVAA